MLTISYHYNPSMQINAVKNKSRAIRQAAAEKVFQISLMGSELTMVIGQLLRCEHDQTALARTAKEEGRLRQARARCDTAKKALELAEKLTAIEAGGAGSWT
jgi:hypothetical protein